MKLKLMAEAIRPSIAQENEWLNGDCPVHQNPSEGHPWVILLQTATVV